MKRNELRALRKDADRAVGIVARKSKGKLDQMMAFHVAGWIFAAVGCVSFVMAARQIHDWWMWLGIILGLVIIYSKMFHSLARIILGIGIAVAIGLTTEWLVLLGIILGVAFVYGGYECLGIQIVPEHERWILKRFKHAIAKLDPGINRSRAFLDTVESFDKVEIREHAVEMIPLPGGDLPKILISEGHFYVRKYVVYAGLYDNFEQLCKALYGLKDWEGWLRDNLHAIIGGGYARPLSLAELTDRIMVSGNILERIFEAPKVVKARIDTLNSRFNRLKKVMEDSEKGASNDSKDGQDGKVDDSNPVLVNYQEEIDRLTDLEKRFKVVAKDLRRFLTKTCPENGIKPPSSVVFGEIKLSDRLEAAREAVAVAKKEAEEALFLGLKESHERTAALLDMLF